MTWHLRNEGHLVNEKRIHPLMGLTGSDANPLPGRAFRSIAPERGPEAQHQ